MESKLLLCLLCVTALAAPPVVAAVICNNENTAVPETTPTADFFDNGDGTVTHTKTGLVWMRCSLGQTWVGTCSGTAMAYTWQQALQVAVDVNSGASNADGDGQAGYAGQSDWRLPNWKELESIAERRCWSPAINAAPFPNTPSDRFWSSSPAAGKGAWSVSGGHANGDFTYYAYRVRLVRAGQ